MAGWAIEGLLAFDAAGSPLIAVVLRLHLEHRAVCRDVGGVLRLCRPSELFAIGPAWLMFHLASSGSEPAVPLKSLAQTIV